jgi:hypothetical protein
MSRNILLKVDGDGSGQLKFEELKSDDTNNPTLRECPNISYDKLKEIDKEDIIMYIGE